MRYICVVGKLHGGSELRMGFSKNGLDISKKSFQKEPVAERRGVWGRTWKLVMMSCKLAANRFGSLCGPHVAAG